MKDKIYLSEIADWQLKPETSEVVLPIIQREFVWKPKQIEDLWDSILRGYPLGSFLMQRIGDKYDLLDGQQRATAIMLGFLDPYSSELETKKWSIRTGRINPTVWVDVDKEAKRPEANKFSIRVTTNAHPWGYQSKDNDKKLSIPDRRIALSEFQKIDGNKDKIYTEMLNKNIYPFDSSLPVPLPLLIKSKTIESLLSCLEILPYSFKTKNQKFSNRDEYIELLRTTYRDDLTDLHSLVQHRISEHNGLKINYDVVENEVINEETEVTDSQQDPTLFIRINSSGTPLRGDDLIYSIYKSLYPDSKNLVESIGASFIPAKSVISLAVRMAYSTNNANNFPERMTVSRFKNQLSNEDFVIALETLIDSESNNFKILFDTAVEILQFSNKYTDKVPDFLVKQLILRNSDLFLFLLTWLKTNKGNEICEDIKIKIASWLYTLDWFNFKNYKLLWKYVKNPNFFDVPLRELTSLSIKNGMKSLVPPTLLREYFEESFELALNIKGFQPDFPPTEQVLKYYNDAYPDADNKEIKEEFTNLIEWIRNTKNKSLISFAQRSYLNDVYPAYNSMESLEDSSVPWDWDHIYPSSWVKNKRVKIFAIRYWTWCIGNYRALSLEQNRSESNNISPAKRLESEEIRIDSFIMDSETNFKNDYQYWQQINERKDDNDAVAEIFTHAVLTRMLNIYQKFWDDFNVQELL